MAVIQVWIIVGGMFVDSKTAINTLDPGRCGGNFEIVISEHATD